MTLNRGACRAMAVSVVFLSTINTAPPGAMADYVRDSQWHLKSLRIAEAHQITRGAGVTVAVIDSGVAAGHPDLVGAVLKGSNVLGDGGDGRQDLGGHGTAMAGIIAARGRGVGRGLLGIAPEADILPIRPGDDTALTIDAIDWATKNGADVVNMSFAVDAAPQLQEALRKAVAADVVLVGSAGNSGNGSNEVEFPAAYPEVLAVGAVDRRGRVASLSQRGPQVDLVAPGVEIPSLKLPAAYGLGTGTSDAAAIVSGAAALVRARFPELSAAEVVERLTATAKDRGPKGRDDAYGHGELDLMAALTAKVPTSAPSVPVPAVDQPVTAFPEGDASEPGISPFVIIGAGVVLLLGATTAAVLVARRRRT